jgi:hypothetical protein
MTAHKPPPHIVALFDESIRRQERLSYDERSALFTQVLLTRPTPFVAPGLEALGVREMRAYGYLRNSKGSFEESTSLLRQYPPFAAFAVSRKLNLLGFYCDADTSGGALVDLPGLMKLLALCRAGMVDVVIVEDCDRLSRSGFLMLVFQLLSQQGIIVIDLFLGKPLTLEIVTLKTLMASSEVAKLGKRTGRGALINAEERNQITKALSAAHTRPYPRGPVAIDPVPAARALEAHVLLDTGSTIGQIVTRFNTEWKNGNADYKPPSKKKPSQKPPYWENHHFMTYGPFSSAIFQNTDLIGEFVHGVSINRKDIGSGKTMQSIRDESEHHTVIRKDLLVVPEDIFKRNRARFEASAARYPKRRKNGSEKLPKTPGPTRIYGGQGKGRRLLSGIVACRDCGAHNFSYGIDPDGGGPIMVCGGVRNSSCNNRFRLPADRLTEIVLDVCEALFSPAGAIEHFEYEYQLEHEAVVAKLTTSKDDLRRKIDGLKIDLRDTVQAKRGSEGEARKVYAEEEKNIAAELKQLETRWSAVEASAGGGPVRKDLLERCRSLIGRLRDPATYRSSDGADVWIVQAMREMLAVDIVPNTWDYGAKAIVTIDCAQFFHKGPAEIETRLRFEIDIPARKEGFRRTPTARIDSKVFENAEAHALTDEEWTALEGLLIPYWIPQNEAFPRLRHNYDSIVLCLRAGAGPGTTRYPHQLNARYHINRHLKNLNLWPEVLRILVSFGHHWVDELDAGLLHYLHAKDGRPGARWVVTEPTFVDAIVSQDSNDTNDEQDPRM